MTLQQLKYMIIVAERGSITEAAKELYISQPSLSGAIKEVEKEAGITINRREKMLKLREELLAVEEGRIAGRNGCTLDELDAYLDDVIAEI